MGFLFLLVIAGNETTTKLIGNALYWLWRFPDERTSPGWSSVEGYDCVTGLGVVGDFSEFMAALV